MTTNEYEAAARQRKIDRVVRALDQLTLIANDGKLDTNSVEFAKATAEVVNKFTEDRWEALAFVARVNVLSPATRSAVKAHLENRLELRKGLEKVDPFEGL